MRNSICNDCAKRTRCDMAEIGRSPLAISTCYGYEKGNPTHYDEIRAMSVEEIENWFWWMHKEMMRYTDSRVFLHDWLRQEVNDGRN